MMCRSFGLFVSGYYRQLLASIYEIFERRLKDIPDGCTFVFHLDGEPLTYRRIQHE